MAEPPTQPPEKRAPSTVDFPPPRDAGEQPTLTGPPKDTPSFSVPSPLSTEEPVACLQSFGDYELLSELGRGGMGVVYQARERQSGRLIALKMMLGEKADLGRFIIEARAAAELSHPGIVTVHSWGNMTAILSLRWIMFPAKPLASFWNVVLCHAIGRSVT